MSEKNCQNKFLVSQEGKHKKKNDAFLNGTQKKKQTASFNQAKRSIKWIKLRCLKD